MCEEPFYVKSWHFIKTGNNTMTLFWVMDFPIIATEGVMGWLVLNYTHSVNGFTYYCHWRGGRKSVSHFPHLLMNLPIIATEMMIPIFIN